MEAGDKLGKYEIRGTLGRGAMGTVYDGWDPLIARRVAIKTVPLLHDGDDAEAEEKLARFRREAQAAGRLQHPNIVGVYDYGETAEFAYLVMEFVDGRTLKSVLDKNERFAIPELTRVMEELLDALQYSHAHGVVHRDVKPANMILARNGQVKVADFGIARIESSSMTQVGTVLGTPAYMSPEQLIGQPVDARSDIYSAGVVLYQLLTGDRPYHGSMTVILHKALNTDVVPPSRLSVTVPEAFDAVVARAMAKRPQERYAAAAEFAAAIHEAALAPEAVPAAADPDATLVSAKAAPIPTPAPMPPAAPPAQPARRSSRAPLLAAVAVAVLALIGGGAWYFTRPGPAVEPGVVTARATSGQPVARATAAAAAIPSAASGPSSAVPPAPPTGEPPRPMPQRAPTAAPAPPAPAPAIVASPSRPSPAPEPAPATPAPALATPPPTSEPQQVAVLSPPVTPAALRSAIAAAVAPVGCALVRGNVAEPGGTVLLTGVAGSGPPETALHRAISIAAPAAAVDWRVAGFDGPYCRALDVLHPVAHGFGAPGSGFAMTLKGGDRPLKDGELITLELSMPDYPAWLQVDYLQHDGTVVHLHPTAKDPSRSYPADSRQALGDPAAGGERWEVGAPYGTDMVIAMASSSPLFTQKRKDFEPADTYLRALQSAIESAERRNVRLAADALVLTTKPRL